MNVKKRFFIIVCLIAIPFFSSFATTPDISANTTTVSCTDSALNTNNAPANLEINWEPNTINLHWYNENTELTVPPESQSCIYDGGLTPPQTIPTRTGYVFKGWRVRKLPDGYTRVNGVTNTGNSGINTSIKDDVDDMEYELRVKPSTNSWYIFQSREWSGGPLYGIAGSQNSNTINGNNGASSLTSSITRNSNHIYYVKYTHKNGNKTLYVRDETSGVEDTQTDTYESYTPATTTIWLFRNGTGNYAYSGNTIYMARLKKNGVMVMDFIPAVNPDNQPGFWDNVTKNFFTGANLKAGPAIQ